MEKKIQDNHKLKDSFMSVAFAQSKYISYTHSLDGVLVGLSQSSRLSQAQFWPLSFYGWQWPMLEQNLVLMQSLAVLENGLPQSHKPKAMLSGPTIPAGAVELGLKTTDYEITNNNSFSFDLEYSIV